jgi:hypothetical protein
MRAAFEDVVTIEEKVVSSSGRLTGLSKYKERSVYVVVPKSIECNDPPWQQYPYQAELNTTYHVDQRVDVSGSDPTTEEIMEAI